MKDFLVIEEEENKGWRQKAVLGSLFEFLYLKQIVVEKKRL